MKRFFAFCSALLLAALAFADNTVTQGTVQLFRGSTNLFTHADVAACLEDIRTRVITTQTSYQCRLAASAVPIVAPPPPPPPPPPPTGAVTYATTFDLTEFPISEGGKWAKANNPWTYVRTANGTAYGSGAGNGYDDSYALLSGFGPNQTVEVVVQVNSGTIGETHEVELLLRFKDDTNNARGYEVLAARDGGIQIIRWNGPYGSITPLAESSCMPGGSWTPKNPLATGHLIKAEMIGNKIQVWQAGVLKACTTDNTFEDGQPGISFFSRAPGSNNLLSLTSFTASSN